MKTGSGRKLRVRLTEKAKVRMVIRQLVDGQWKHLRTVERNGQAGMNLLALGGLSSASRYRMAITATDGSGNVSRTRHAQFRIRFH